MKNRTPAPANGGAPLPDFQPVDRRYRHDGWTPTRQRAFIAALADTGSVSRACALVNMAPEGAYMLRRQAGAESFRRAWEAALDFGVQRLRDIAMERALTGELVPVMSFGKLVGYRRVTNDRARSTGAASTRLASASKPSSTSSSPTSAPNLAPPPPSAGRQPVRRRFPLAPSPHPPS